MDPFVTMRNKIKDETNKIKKLSFLSTEVVYARSDTVFELRGMKNLRETPHVRSGVGLTRGLRISCG